MGQWKKQASAICVLVLCMAWTAHADTVTQVNFDGVGEYTNSFNGFIRYQSASPTATEGALTISLTNDYKPGYREAGNITAFVFNIEGATEYELLRPNPTDLDPTSPSAWWSLTSETQLSDTEPVNPYGQFEAGVGIATSSKNASFLGGGNGSDTEGLMGGETGVFKFKVIGPNAGGLDAWSFITEGSTGTKNPQSFVVRYKGIGPNDYSNKGIGYPGEPIPLPAAVWGGFVLFGLVGVRRMARQRESATL